MSGWSIQLIKYSLQNLRNRPHPYCTIPDPCPSAQITPNYHHYILLLRRLHPSWPCSKISSAHTATAKWATSITTSGHTTSRQMPNSGLDWKLRHCYLLRRRPVTENSFHSLKCITDWLGHLESEEKLQEIDFFLEQYSLAKIDSTSSANNTNNIRLYSIIFCLSEFYFSGPYMVRRPQVPPSTLFPFSVSISLASPWSSSTTWTLTMGRGTGHSQMLGWKSNQLLR